MLLITSPGPLAIRRIYGLLQSPKELTSRDFYELQRTTMCIDGLLQTMDFAGKSASVQMESQSIQMEAFSGFIHKILWQSRSEPDRSLTVFRQFLCVRIFLVENSAGPSDCRTDCRIESAAKRPNSRPDSFSAKRVNAFSLGTHMQTNQLN